MSLWKRLKAWREALKAERQAFGPAREQGLTDAACREGATPGVYDTSMVIGLGAVSSETTYGSPGGADCGPTVSGDCGGTVV
jgi:hypothetical protein